MSLTVYPAALDEFPVRVDGPDQWIRAEHLNLLQDSVSVIEEVLGLNPQGAYPTVSDRIAAAGGGGSGTTRRVSEIVNSPQAFGERTFQLSYKPVVVESVVGYIEGINIVESSLSSLGWSQAGNQVCQDENGNIYLLAAQYGSVYKLDAITGNISVVVGNLQGLSGDAVGPGNLAKLTYPVGIAYYNGNVYICDTNNFKIKAFDINTGIVSTLIDLNLSSWPGNPYSVSVDLTEANPCLYIAMGYPVYGVLRYDLVTAALSIVAGGNGNGDSGEGGLAINAQLSYVFGVTSNATSFFLSDAFNGKVKVVDKATGIITTLTSGLGQVCAIAIDGSFLYVCSNTYYKIFKINSTTGVTVDYAGNGDPNNGTPLDQYPMLATLSPLNPSGVSIFNNRVYLLEVNIGLMYIDLTDGLLYSMTQTRNATPFSNTKRASLIPMFGDEALYDRLKDPVSYPSMDIWGCLVLGLDKSVKVYFRSGLYGQNYGFGNPSYSYSKFYVTYLTNDAP